MKAEGQTIHFPKILGKSADLAAVFSSQNTDSNFVSVSLRDNRMTISSRGTSGWSEIPVKVKYDGPEIGFSIDPGLLKRISQMTSMCSLSERALKVKSGKFTYLSCLGDVK
jgi:hypothetical protein